VLKRPHSPHHNGELGTRLHIGRPGVRPTSAGHADLIRRIARVEGDDGEAPRPGVRSVGIAPRDLDVVAALLGRADEAEGEFLDDVSGWGEAGGVG
jgi:hypothetical protein